MESPTFVSSREAIAVLRAAGVGACSAERVLATGLAGEPVRTRSVVLFDERLVLRLAERPVVPGRDLADHCPQGLFVARREAPSGLTREDRERWFGGGWGGISPWVMLRLHLEIERVGPRPFVACTGGFVTFGAEITRVGSGRGASPGFELTSPGPWFEAFEGTRLRMGPGRPWVIHGPTHCEEAPPPRVRIGR